jgi:hypothetical protein
MIKATFRSLVIASVFATPFISFATPTSPVPPVLKSSGKLTPTSPVPPVLKSSGKLTPTSPVPPVLKSSGK